MRLLRLTNTSEAGLTKDFVGDDIIPSYAILSHIWGADNDEVTFKDIQEGTGKEKPGYVKIQFCAQQAIQDGLQYFWIDTCCIDKANHFELQNAINSMFYWYQNAARCYVYLSDVSVSSRFRDDKLSQQWIPAFKASRWFTRGWTLQDLIAPASVKFFSREGQQLGDKQSLEQILHDITGINVEALRGTPLSQFSIDERMSWVERRQTAREEDAAYCLLGIFDVHIPPIYGEGREKAFDRLGVAIRNQECVQYLRLVDPRDEKMRIEETMGGLPEDSHHWILENSDFQQWSNDQQIQLLCIKGNPGTGKTILLCGVVNELKKSIAKTGLLSYFFCQASDSRVNNATAVLRGLIYLLVDQRPLLISHVQKKYDFDGQALFEDANAWVTLSEILSNILQDPSLDSIYLVIDAIDECKIDLPKLLDFIVQKSTIPSRAKWIVSGRNEWGKHKSRLVLELNEESNVIISDHGAESDAVSNFSDAESAWSVPFTESSQSSYGEVQVLKRTAAGIMAEILWESSDLRPLYLEISNQLRKEAFAKNHDSILKRFFEDLRSEIANDSHLKTIRILRNRSQRQQITDWIFNLVSPQLDIETLQARSNFLNQREHRKEMLERFLQSQTEQNKAHGQHIQEGAADSDSSDEESGDEDNIMPSEELDAIVQFLTSGVSFATLRINLYALAHPETAVAEALQTENIEILQALFAKQFNRVAIGEYAWLRELEAAGYPKSEIAELLFEESTDSPWIYFRPRSVSPSLPDRCDPEFHLPGCIHRKELEPYSRSRLHTHSMSNTDDFPEEIQILCGLAGIAPTSRDKSMWDGSIEFLEGNTVAEVTYAMKKDVEDVLGTLLMRSISTLQRSLSAARYLQNVGGCCDAFSVLTHKSVPLLTPAEELDPVELFSIKFGSVLRLLNEIQNLHVELYEQKLCDVRATPVRSAWRHLQETALDILETLDARDTLFVEHPSLDDILHIVALVAQFVSLALLSYSNAHIGPLQPFFLDNGQVKISLLGMHTTGNSPFRIVAQVTELTCI